MATNRELGVDLDAARMLHEYALHVALGDPQRAANVYLNSLYSYAEAQRVEPPPVPGRLTRAAYEASPGKRWTPDELAELPIGKFTRVQIETTREDKFPGYDEWRTSTEALSAAVQSASLGAAVKVASEQAAVRSENDPAVSPVPTPERRAASAPAPVIAWRRAADEAPRPHPFGARGAKRVPVPPPAAPPVPAIAAAPLVPAVAPDVSPQVIPASPPPAVALRQELEGAVVMPPQAFPASPPPAVALRQELEGAVVAGSGAATSPAAPAPASEAKRQLRAVDAPRLVATATGQGEHADLSNRAHAPAIAEPAVEPAPHPVDAFRTNVRGLAADLTRGGVGVGRTAARLLWRAAAAPAGRRAAEVADTWTGGAA